MLLLWGTIIEIYVQIINMYANKLIMIWLLYKPGPKLYILYSE